MLSANAKPTAEAFTRRWRHFRFLSMKKLCLVFGIFWAVSSGCFGKDAYRFLSEIPVGGEGGWDILTIDPTANRLYLSHAAKVVVVDLGKSAVIGEIDNTPGVHAFVAVPELQRGFSSNGKEDKSSVVDLKTLQTTSKIDTGPNPDAIALDAGHHRLFAGCHNQMMVMLDTESGKVVGSVPIGSGVDGCAFDDATQLAFASCGDGTTTIAIEQAPNKLAVVQILKTERGSRTMALDPETHRIYLPAAQFQPPPSPSPGVSPGRPSVLSNTLKLIVYRPPESVKH